MGEFEARNISPNSEDIRRNSISESSEQPTDSYLLIPYGFQPKTCYKPKAKSKEITEVTYNSRSRQFLILDSKGITSWSHNSVINSVSRLLDYPSYQFNLIRLLLHCKKFNVYFGLSKDYALKVFNLNFHEVFSVISDMNSVLCMVFNSVTDELITGGTGGIRFWTFDELQIDGRSASRDARPMANYGLILRREHPAMSGRMVKDIILDENMQRLYCLSERNVLAYDMKGSTLFELKSAHQGQVTGCIYSKFSNFVVTAGTDCAVNVWSSNGGRLHSFNSHSKIVTNLLLHPEAPSLVITSSQDGTVKIFSLDIMEEIYSQVVFTESIEWMSFISQDLLYCCSSRALQVFSINHVTNFWTTLRCPLRSISLTAGSRGNGRNVLAIAEDYSARFLSKDGRLLSTVLPPPPITTGQQSRICCAHAYCPMYGLMYVMVNQEEIWVYYTKSNPANRVEVWNLSDAQDISNNRESSIRNDNTSSRPVSSRVQSSSSPLIPPAKIIDGVPCLSLLFLHSNVNLKNKAGESYTDLMYYLVVGLQDGRLLFTSPFSALVVYYQFQATKGAILSIKHDTTADLLLLNTVTLNKYTIQIRHLPDLDIKHNIDAGNDLTCFVRLGCSFLTGHESGRLNLYHLNFKEVTHEVERRKFDGQKVSKDHLDLVLAVDANNDLQLFCSSSMDGSIKIWNNSKVLLREIIMDRTLTTVCFLNSAGDLLAGFKNHVFSISREKAHLVSYSSRRNSELHETGSDIYEDPRVRFEYKKTIPSDPVRMETYLVPFANISINLARFLSGHLPSNTLQNDIESEIDGTESEISDAFSVAPTDIYMSQSGTPQHSRSRSSSLASSWNLPNIGSSPVSSPPRTPPPFMSPVLELESEEESTTSDHEISENKNNYLTNDNKPGTAQGSKKTVKPILLFSRQKRTGLSERKIDSRALQSKASVNVAKNADNLRRKRETTTNQSSQASNLVSSNRPARTVVKKTKKQTVKSKRKVAKLRQPFENQMVDNPVNPQDDSGENKEEIKLNKMEEKPTLNPVEEKRLDEGTPDTGEGLRDDNKVETLTLDEELTDKGVADQDEVVLDKQADDLIAQDGKLSKTEQEESFTVEAFQDIIKSTKEEMSVIRDSNERLSRENTLTNNDSDNDDDDNGDDDNDDDDNDDDDNDDDDDDDDDNDDDVSDKKEVELHDPSSPTPLSREHSLTNIISNLDIQESRNQLQSPDNNPNCDKDLHSEEENAILNEQESTSSSDNDDDHSEDNLDTTDEKPDVLTSKNVSFVVTEAPEDFKRQGLVSTRSMPRRKISGRRSVSPINSTPKVVPVLGSQSNDDAHGQRLHPSSALKIYALAKTRRRTASGGSLVSRPRVKQCSFVKHNTSEVSIHENDIDRNVARIPKTFVAIQADGRVSRTLEDNQGGEVKVKDKERRKEKKDLVNWCLNALSEKAKYPIFSPKPRLRSRRSMLKEEKSNGAIVAEIPDSNDHQNDSDDGSPDWKDKASSRKNVRQDVFDLRCSFEDNFDSFAGVRRLHTVTSGRAEAEVNALDYSEGWQERLLDKTREMKEKHFERKQKVLQKRLVDKHTLEEKRCLVELYGSTGTYRDETSKSEEINRGSRLMDDNYELPKHGVGMGKPESQGVVGSNYGPQGISKDNRGIKMGNRQESYGINMSKEDKIDMDNHGYQATHGSDLKRVRSSYENFKNNPVIIQPYRLEKFNSTKDELLLQGLNLDLEAAELPDQLQEFISRPKSAPSIPSKCRKYVLVGSDSETTRNRPAPTALEEMLMLERFPNKSNLGKLRSRSCSPFVSQIRRPRSLQKIQNVDMSCK